MDSFLLVNGHKVELSIAKRRKKVKASNTTKVNFSIQKDLHRELKVLAAQKSIRITDAVELSIKDYLARN